jgi:anti-sigma regulatory factor (Ser/Thr protein kinase)
MQAQSRTFAATMAQFPAMQQFVGQAAAQAGFAPGPANKVLLASEEALVNVINYAYPQGPGMLTLSCGASSERPGLCIRIEDSGVAFDPLARPDPDVTVPLEERPIGGLGIFMVKQIMDRVSYERADGRNVLTMVKFLTAPA